MGISRKSEKKLRGEVDLYKRIMQPLGVKGKKLKTINTTETYASELW